MSRKYKKVYIEITNYCNLSCDFCIKNKRVREHITIDNFKILLEKLKPYTKYLYFHILGEPLMHPDICKLIDLASQDYYVNITTNGYLIDRIKNNPNIRQVNISLHSFSLRYKLSLNEYLDKVFDGVDCLLKNNTYISLRLWVDNLYGKEIRDYIEKRYDCKIDFSGSSFRIKSYLYVSQFHEFIWPDLENDFYSDVGTCYGLRDHFGVLVDGTIVPCCLDSCGHINLGNIYQDDLGVVLSSERCINMREGFQNYEKREELCKHCSFLEK